MYAAVDKMISFRMQIVESNLLSRKFVNVRNA